MSRSTVHTDPVLRADAVALREKLNALAEDIAPIELDSLKLIARLVARIEELEALARTPRFTTDEDTRRVFEVTIRCSRCHKWFVYDSKVDVRERTEKRSVFSLRPPSKTRFTVCPCGAERTLAIGANLL